VDEDVANLYDEEDGGEADQESEQVAGESSDAPNTGESGDAPDARESSSGEGQGDEVTHELARVLLGVELLEAFAAAVQAHGPIPLEEIPNPETQNTLELEQISDVHGEAQDGNHDAIHNAIHDAFHNFPNEAIAHPDDVNEDELYDRETREAKLCQKIVTAFLVHTNIVSLRNLIVKKNAVIETNNKILRMMDAIGQKRDTHVEGMKAMLQTSQNTVVKQDAVIDEMDASIKELRATVAAWEDDEAIMDMKRDAERKDAYNNELEATISVLSTEVEQKAALVEDLKSTIRIMKEKAKEKEKEYAERKDTVIGNLEYTITIMKKQAGEKETQYKDLLAKSEKDHKDLVASCKHKDANIEYLRGMLNCGISIIAVIIAVVWVKALVRSLWGLIFS
jgi:hypothetical protein